MNTKVLRVKEGSDTLILVTYRACHKGFLVREDVRVINLVKGEKRYHGKSPIVFIPKEKSNDLGVLNVANLTKTAIENVLMVKNELDMVRMIKEIFKGKELIFEKEVYTNEMADVKLVRPNVGFTVFTKSMFTDIANGIVESVSAKNG